MSYYDTSYPPSLWEPEPPVVIPATGATAGGPGSWTPAGSQPPASVAALIAGTPNAVTASPTTAWTTGQYVQTGTAGAAGQAHWSGTGWVAAPAVLQATRKGKRGKMSDTPEPDEPDQPETPEDDE